MQIIPLQTLPAQSFITILEEQNVEISLYQRYNRLYADVTLDETPIATGCICLNNAPIIQHTSDFSGVLAFVDTLGDEPPQWEGIGGDSPRWVLVYLTAAEVVENGIVV